MIPQSSSQISPRSGVILFGVQRRHEVIGGSRSFRIVQRAGIKRDRASQKFDRKDALLVVGERFVRVEQFSGFLAHFSSIVDSEARSPAEAGKMFL